ncbi:MAG: hypothetical protein DCF26_04465 [Burkholderiales bacterium]|nr:MAG: hypothetical protein DCF26_04465 [Burkholderiales bacterium]
MKFDPKDRATNLKVMITLQQEGLGLSDSAIADALGYANPRVIEMIKSGLMKLPMNKAAALANALKVEPGEVMHLLLTETSPGMLTAIEECMGPLCLSPGERRLLMALRKSSGGRESAPIFFDGAPIVAVIVGS